MACFIFYLFGEFTTIEGIAHSACRDYANGLWLVGKSEAYEFADGVDPGFHCFGLQAGELAANA